MFTNSPLFTQLKKEKQSSIPTPTLPLDQPIRSSIFWPNLESSLLQALFLGSTDHFCFLRAAETAGISLHNGPPTTQYYIMDQGNKLSHCRSTLTGPCVHTQNWSQCRIKTRQTYMLCHNKTKVNTDRSHSDSHTVTPPCVSLTHIWSPCSSHQDNWVSYT